MREKAGLSLLIMTFLNPPCPAQSSLETLVLQSLKSGEAALSRQEEETSESHFREALAAALLQLGAVSLTLQNYQEAERAYHEASRAMGTEAEQTFALALDSFQNNQYEECIDRIGAVAKESPQDRRATILLAKAYYLAGDLEKAREQVIRAYGDSPDQMQGLYLLSLVRLKQKQPEEGKRLLRRLKAGLGESASLLRLIARTYLETGYPETARREFERAEELGSGRKKVEPALSRGAPKKEKSGSPQEETEASGVGTPSPPASRPDSNRSLLLEREIWPPSTVRPLRRLGQTYRRFAARAYAGLSRIHAFQGDFQRVVVDRRRALFWDARLPDARYQLAWALYRADRPVDAATPLMKTCRTEPSGPRKEELAAQLARALLAAGDVEPAEELSACYLERAPENPHLHLIRGLIQTRKRSYPLALQEFHSALRIDPALPDAHYYTALSLLALGRQEEALQEFEAELRARPDYARAQYQKASILLARNQLQEAEVLLENVLRSDPKHARAYHKLGRIQLQKGQVVEALAHLETAVALGLSDPQVFYALWQAYSRSGREEEAQRALQRFRELQR
ncbi:MAG: tetratricopeptide repeat protein [Acidobacteriota bacterium]